MSVELIGYYGGDTTHALSAWTSTEREITEEKHGRVDKLLKFLAENKHHTPFEKSFLHFVVEADTASHIQILKHRIGVSVNGESARYKQMEPRFLVPDDWPQKWKDILRRHAGAAEAWYQQALGELEMTLGRKRAKESARFFLPYANVLTLDVTFNFRSFMHFQELRNHVDAQVEINDIAEEMLKLVKDTRVFNHSLKGFGY